MTYTNTLEGLYYLVIHFYVVRCKKLIGPSRTIFPCQLAVVSHSLSDALDCNVLFLDKGECCPTICTIIEFNNQNTRREFGDTHHWTWGLYKLSGLCHIWGLERFLNTILMTTCCPGEKHRFQPLARLMSWFVTESWITNSPQSIFSSAFAMFFTLSRNTNIKA